MTMNIQEAYRTPHSLIWKRNSSCHIIAKIPNALNKERILKVVKETGEGTHKADYENYTRLLNRDRKPEDLGLMSYRP